MRRVTLLYFAALRDLVGVTEESLDLDAPVANSPEEPRTAVGADTVNDLLQWLPRVHPTLEGRLASVRVARNEVFADPEEPLCDGDVIALIPPVAGG